MDNIHSEYQAALETLGDYVKKTHKFKDRFISLAKDINHYIETTGLKGKLKLNEIVLGYALVDYFEDIERLKRFHNVEHVNAIKVVSYTAYWLLRRKPIQILSAEKDIIYCNELFVLAYILDFISSEENDYVLKRSNIGLRSFADSLLYYLKYREVTAQSLEMILISFFAGQIYQEREKDLSSELGNKYKGN